MTDFGTSLSWVEDMSPEASVVAGTRLIAEALARRWMTANGTLLGFPDYGLDIPSYLNTDVTPSDILALQSAASSEALKDPRVSSCATTMSLDSDGLLSVEAELFTSEGPFTLVASVSSIGVKILGIK